MHMRLVRAGKAGRLQKLKLIKGSSNQDETDILDDWSDEHSRDAKKARIRGAGLDTRQTGIL